VRLSITTFLNSLWLICLRGQVEWLWVSRALCDSCHTTFAGDVIIFAVQPRLTGTGKLVVLQICDSPRNNYLDFAFRGKVRVLIRRVRAYCGHWDGLGQECHPR